jgi:glutathione synthase/RimK-type ligase-like ATP-grasp enzyme
MPVTARIGRSTLEEIALGQCPLETVLAGAAFPIIVRPAGSHAGHGLVKIDRPSEIAEYLQTRLDAEFCITPFIDYRRPDGLFRKYRIALIDGRPFLCHLGISEHWMIHYANAGMAESAAKRAEEAHVMAMFDEDFASRHATAFQAINERMGLDYLAIDCGEAPDGRLLIFEVDNSMVVHAMDPVDLYPYKVPQMHKVFAAFRAMLAGRMAGSVRACGDRVIPIELQAAGRAGHLNQ